MPASGPMPNGSGAAWFFDLRWFHTPLTEKLTSSVSSYLDVGEPAVALERDLEDN